MIFDDTVLDKDFSSKIEGVRKQYSGNAHGLVRGIGIVNCLYYNPELDKYWIVDYRTFDPEVDGKTKLDHVRDMLMVISGSRKEMFDKVRTVLMDSYKGTTGIEMCQCRKRRSQRNHVCCCLLVWHCLTDRARQAKTTIYQLKQKLLDDYMIKELKSPSIKFV